MKARKRDNGLNNQTPGNPKVIKEIEVNIQNSMFNTLRGSTEQHISNTRTGYYEIK